MDALSTLIEVRDQLAYLFSDTAFTSDVGRHFTCTEAEAMAEVLRTLDLNDIADAWMAAHAEGDDSDDSCKLVLAG